MKFAICTASGQSRFLTDDQRFVLAPNRAIATFASHRAATEHVMKTALQNPAVFERAVIVQPYNPQTS
jgi:hypothetical protein